MFRSGLPLILPLTRADFVKHNRVTSYRPNLFDRHRPPTTE